MVKFDPKFDYAKVEEQIAREAKERQSAGGGDKRSAEAKSLNSNLNEPIRKKPAPQTVDKIAEKVGVSRNTIMPLRRIRMPSDRF